MIDIHSHVLPQIDDGPASWEETMAMLRQAEADGITEVAITHHILSNLDYEREPEILAKFEELKQRLALEKLEIKIHLACEIYAQVDMELHHTISTYDNNQKYFLVEFPMQGIPRFTGEYFFQVINDGMTPIVAHPERNMGIVRNPERAYEFVQRGALLQMNGGSILGRHGGSVTDAARILLNANLIHFVGSDGHNTRRRPLQLSEAFSKISAEWGEERARALFYDNPAKAIAGKPIKIPEPKPVEPLKRGFWGTLKKVFNS